MDDLGEEYAEQQDVRPLGGVGWGQGLAGEGTCPGSRRLRCHPTWLHSWPRSPAARPTPPGRSSTPFALHLQMAVFEEAEEAGEEDEFEAMFRWGGPAFPARKARPVRPGG